MTSNIMTYRVNAQVVQPGVSRAVITGKTGSVDFDSSAGQGPDLPGPADLLVTAFAACVLKNVERMSKLQRFDYSGASIEVTAEREESPPRIARITYTLRVETTESERTMELLHHNIVRQGTIYNTLARSCEVTGDLLTLRPNDPT